MQVKLTTGVPAPHAAYSPPIAWAILVTAEDDDSILYEVEYPGYRMVPFKIREGGMTTAVFPMPTDDSGPVIDGVAIIASDRADYAHHFDSLGPMVLLQDDAPLEVHYPEELLRQIVCGHPLVKVVRKGIRP